MRTVKQSLAWQARRFGPAMQIFSGYWLWKQSISKKKFEMHKNIRCWDIDRQKGTKTVANRHLIYLEDPWHHKRGTIFFLKKQLANMPSVQIQLDVYVWCVYPPYANWEVLTEIPLRLSIWMVSYMQSTLLVTSLKTDLILKQDGYCHLFSNILQTEQQVIKKYNSGYTII